MQHFDIRRIEEMVRGLSAPLYSYSYAVPTKVDEKYPPTDIIKVSDTETRVVFAVAGMSKDDIEISFKQGELEVTGTFQDQDDEAEYYTQGIAKRNFKRVFTLNEHMVVKDSKMEDGLLTINLELKLPKELQPKKIKIN